MTHYDLHICYQTPNISRLAIKAPNSHTSHTIPYHTSIIFISLYVYIQHNQITFDCTTATDNNQQQQQQEQPSNSIIIKLSSKSHLNFD